jgi:hypothetical protein
MGHPDGAHTHGNGGSGGTAVLVVLAAAFAVAVAQPVLAAVAELVHALLIAAGVILGLAAVGLAAIVTWRLRQSHTNRITSVSFPARLPPRPAQALSEPPRPAISRPAEVHLHFHGVTAEDIAAAIRAAPEDGHTGR